MINAAGRLLPFIFAILLFSCASGYKTIAPSSLNYSSSGENDNGFSYKYNVLRDSRNTKYAKKEDKFRTRIVAVKIENKTGKTLQYGDNYRIYSGDHEVTILDPEVAVYAIRQKVPTYLLYLLLTGTTLSISDNRGVNETPIGYVLGPALTGLNVIVAATANAKLREDLEHNSIINKQIRSGQTFYGLVAIIDNSFMPLSIRIDGIK